MPVLSFTQLRHRSVHDSQGALVGTLEDLLVLPLGTRPQVTKFSLQRPDREEWVLPWTLIAEVRARPEVPIRLRAPLTDLTPVGEVAPTRTLPRLTVGVLITGAAWLTTVPVVSIVPLTPKLAEPTPSSPSPLLTPLTAPALKSSRTPATPLVVPARTTRPETTGRLSVTSSV